MWDKFILNTSKQTAKISKTGFAKIGHCSFQAPMGCVSSKKTGCGFFHQSHPHALQYKMFRSFFYKKCMAPGILEKHQTCHQNVIL